MNIIVTTSNQQSKRSKTQTIEDHLLLMNPSSSSNDLSLFINRSAFQIMSNVPDIDLEVTIVSSTIYFD